jgi:hypothetical protein
VFGNKVTKRIIGPTRDKVTGGLEKLHNEKFNNVYSSSNSPAIVIHMGEVCSQRGRDEKYIRSCS